MLHVLVVMAVFSVFLRHNQAGVNILAKLSERVVACPYGHLYDRSASLASLSSPCMHMFVSRHTPSRGSTVHLLTLRVCPASRYELSFRCLRVSLLSVLVALGSACLSANARFTASRLPSFFNSETHIVLCPPFLHIFRSFAFAESHGQHAPALGRK